MTKDRYFRPGAKAGALKDLARQVLDPRRARGTRATRDGVAARARRRDSRRATAPSAGSSTTTSSRSISGWSDLDESFVAIQGPPGTGKTYSGSHIIHHLVGRGLRVGVFAMSHGAIDNLMTATA